MSQVYQHPASRQDRIRAMMPMFAGVTRNKAEQYRLASTRVDAYDFANQAMAPRPTHGKERIGMPVLILGVITVAAAIAAFVMGLH